jgi:hypothetical protein
VVRDLNTGGNIMSSATLEQPRTTETIDREVNVEPVVALKRRTIDSVLIGFGVVATATFAVAGGLLAWGHNFSSDYVGSELSSQNISFPSAAELTEEGRTDLVQFADQQVDTGSEAEAYASFINGHLADVAKGATYADLGVPESAAKADVAAAVKAGKSTTEVAALQAKADVITGQRNTMFKGETLRGLLLSAYAWSTVGTIAGYAAFGAFAAAAIMLVLVGLGVIHHRRTPKTA